MISYETFRSMMDDFVEESESNTHTWKEFLCHLINECHYPEDVPDAIAYMKKEREYLDTIVRDHILDAMCKTIVHAKIY